MYRLLWEVGCDRSLMERCLFLSMALPEVVKGFISARRSGECPEF